MGLEHDAFLKHLEKAREVADSWPEWKRRSGLRFWPNGAAPSETKRTGRAARGRSGDLRRAFDAIRGRDGTRGND